MLFIFSTPVLIRHLWQLKTAVFPAYVPKTVCSNHRYIKKSRLLKFCYVPAASAASSKGIFAAATNSTNQTNKAGGTRIDI